MYISQKIREQSIALYLLYMWQIEDLIRANNLDIERIKEQVIAAYGLKEEQEQELVTWYENLIEMMREERIVESGHLRINHNVILWLTDLHVRLLKSSKFPFYSAAYYKALPLIVELRAKNGQKEISEIETCFEAMYGIYILRLQKKEVSSETAQAMKTIEDFLALLSDYYLKEKAGVLELE